jgi:4-hydroxy-4-methyl-2-oxoglutarate aldolase
MGGRGALDYQIKAINPASAGFTGTALTCYSGPDDALAILAAFEIAQPGDVVVAATEAFKGSAVVGDLFAAMAVTSSVAAIVTDGLARDCDGIIATGLPRLRRRHLTQLRGSIRTRHHRAAGCDQQRPRGPRRCGGR